LQQEDKDRVFFSFRCKKKNGPLSLKGARASVTRTFFSCFALLLLLFIALLLLLMEG